MGGTLCALSGRCTEKPKLTRAGLRGVACTLTAAVVGSDAVWVKASVVGCRMVACVATPTPAAVVGSDAVWAEGHCIWLQDGSLCSYTHFLAVCLCLLVCLEVLGLCVGVFGDRHLCSCVAYALHPW